MQAVTVLKKKHSGCVTRLRSDQYKRVPADEERAAIGYYVHCPECDMIAVVLAEENEASDPCEVLSVAKPFVCMKCKQKKVIRGGEFFDA